MLDLPYTEDSQAMTDMNIAMTGNGQFIEIQGTAEHRPFSRDELGTLLDLAQKGNSELQQLQREALEMPLGETLEYTGKTIRPVSSAEGR